jgi:transcriptional regulator with XRE-family HTH domain
VPQPKNPVLVAFGKRLRQIREKRELSQERLAELANLHRNTVGSLERGEVNISLLAIASLSKVLRVKPAELIKTVHAYSS